MRQYEVTFIVDPVLSSEEIKSTAHNYVEQIESEGSEIVHIDELGLRPLAYPIKKRTSGIYYCVEFKTPTGDIINKLELALRRDERIVRFLTVALDKYGIKYNEDKRNGLIGKKRSKKDAADAKKTERPKKEKVAATPIAAAPVLTAPVAAAPVAEAKKESPSTTEEEE
jgi:small subunit ribosomal protein S6